MKGKIELRTLKDLVSCPPLMKEEFKQEAIKWIKDIDKDLKEFENMQGQVVKNEFVDKVQGLIATREWIKHFFNINEEDVK